ncbi:MAG: hypothetical protein IPL28_01490 [Chloroflexi bacterium]|nr:hypothetical protein [Chloroflexota bacterium]
MVILAYLAWLVNLVCWIFVLTKMFPAKGALHGILAILCGLYAFIWGWQNSSKYENMRNVMIVWSIAVVVSAITNQAAISSAMGG